MNNGLERMWTEGRSLIEELSCNLPGEAEESHENLSINRPFVLALDDREVPVCVYGGMVIVRGKQKCSEKNCP
jgi:hypothetical protein